jgi:hypothetical protein
MEVNQCLWRDEFRLTVDDIAARLQLDRHDVIDRIRDA